MFLGSSPGPGRGPNNPAHDTETDGLRFTCAKNRRSDVVDFPYVCRGNRTLWARHAHGVSSYNIHNSTYVISLRLTGIVERYLLQPTRNLHL